MDRPARGIRALAPPALTAAALWWTLAGDAGWAFGGAAVVAATLASAALRRPGRGGVDPLALAPFAAWFLRESIRGGIDVARRALHPALPLAPAWHDHRCALDGAALATFLVCTNLMPGTLAVRRVPGGIRVHALDPRLLAGLAALEARVARLHRRPPGSGDAP